MSAHAQARPRPRLAALARAGARALACAGGLAALAALAWAAFAPVASPSREELFEIPKGTWARRMAGDPVEILPDHVRLTLGVRDVLVLRNHDEVPQIFGPTLMMPGQSFRLPFATAASYPFACTAHASGQMTVEVEPFPATPWARLRWRLRELLRAREPAVAGETGGEEGSR